MNKEKAKQLKCRLSSPDAVGIAIGSKEAMWLLPPTIKEKVDNTVIKTKQRVVVKQKNKHQKKPVINF